MNSKALVEIAVPAAEKKFDVYIPLDSKLGEILMLVADVLSELSEGKYKATPDAMLCYADTGEPLDKDVEAAELGIITGTRLMLI